MKILKTTVVYLIFGIALFAFGNQASAQNAALLSKLTIEDYQKMSVEQQAVVKQDLTAALKVDTNFRKYNQLQQDNELAFAGRDRSKPINTQNAHPKTKEKWMAKYQDQGIGNPQLYYQNEIQSNRALFAVVRKYLILAKLDNASKMAIFQAATITPPAFYQKLAKAVGPKSYVIH